VPAQAVRQPDHGDCVAVQVEQRKGSGSDVAPAQAAVATVAAGISVAGDLALKPRRRGGSPA